MGKLIKYITMEDVQKLMKAEKRRNYKLAIALGFGSGLRISEIVGRKRKDGKGIPALTQDRVNLKEHQIVIEQGKGKKDRITVTSPYLNETNIKLLPLKIPLRTLQHNFTQLAKRVLKQNMSFHTLRHGFGNYMVNDKEVPLPMVQMMMGHSRVDTTGMYAKANPQKAIARAWESFG